MAEFKFPTEEVELPSKGWFYPEEHPLAKGVVEMKYMTAKEEDILTNANYIQDGTVLDRLLSSLIISPKFDFDDMLTGDKSALLISSRILGYGKNYPIKIAGKEENVDLTTLKNVEVDFDNLPKNTNKFNYTLPNSGTKITFKLLTGKDEKKIEKDLEGIRKITPDASPEISTRLKTIITSVEGDGTPKVIGEFVDNYLLAMDSRALRHHYKKCMPDVDLSFRSSDGRDRTIPINLSFFWPDANL
jgi:hypothetical protein